MIIAMAMLSVMICDHHHHHHDLYLCSLEHVVYDVVHLRDQSVQSHLQQHHDGSAHVLPHLWIIITGQEEEVLDELIDVNHESLTATNDELVDTSYGVRSDLGTVVSEEC